MNRESTVKRKTNETDISVTLKLDCFDKSVVSTGVPFFDHMINSFSRHGRFYLNIQCKGDIEIDDHHSVEDIGIVLGQAFKQALGDKIGITRFGNAVIPMDDALSMVTVDLSGRPYFKYTGQKLSGYVAKYSEELTLEFFRSFTDNAEINFHIESQYGDNRHHIHESIFKAAGIALYRAASIDTILNGIILSTKGSI